MKIFQIGLNKTGTTSLHSALEILGFRSFHDSKATSLIDEIKAGKSDLLDEYDAFTDKLFYKEFRFLKEQFPDAKFVLTTRDKEQWIQSRVCHVLCNRVTQEYEWKDINTISWEEEWDEHHKTVREYFSDDPNFLEMNIPTGDGWDKLCPFLDCPTPDEQFPWKNNRNQKLDTVRGYQFTTDWFSRRIPLWEKWLDHLKDKPTKALEIGSYEGRSAIWLLENILTDPDASLQCVDVWMDSEIEKRFDRNIVTSGHSLRVKKTKAESHRALRWMPLDHFHFIYIDGAHEGFNVIEDAVLSSRLLRKNGVLIFDDYLWEGEHRNVLPKPAIDAFLSIYAHRIKVVHQGYQTIIRRHT